MGRGIAREARTTKKCSCDNPKHYKNWIKVNGNTGEITYYISCANCNAYWASKDRESRKLWDMHKVPGIFFDGCNYNGNKTCGELFAELDRDRLEYLEKMKESATRKLEEAQREYDKACKAVDKFSKLLED